MPGIIVVGAQFGDEGKGKITDFLAKNADIVARYQGGNNAGHTVCAKETTLKLNHIPSGVLYEKEIMIGAGCLVDPRTLIKEIELIKKAGLRLRLTIDPRCHIIMPYHNLLDEAMESGENVEKIGTTKKGIGPAYADKALRQGIRFEDILNMEILEKKLGNVFEKKKQALEKVFGMKVTFTAQEIAKEYFSLGEKLAGYAGDVSLEVCNAVKKKKTVLFESAQGTFLDNDFGTYPYVTSSHPLTGGAAIGIGMPINNISRAIGVVKAYTSRVGEGPFPTELSGNESDMLREKGNEYGTVTGRPRRVGWLDIPMLRTACRLNGFTELALTKLDVLSGIKQVKAAIAYRTPKIRFRFFPYSNKGLEKAEPVYKTFPGFTLAGREKKFADLPKNAKTYLSFIEKELKTPISLISIGPERSQTIIAKK